MLDNPFITRRLYPDELRILKTLRTKQEKKIKKGYKFYYIPICVAVGERIKPVIIDRKAKWKCLGSFPGDMETLETNFDKFIEEINNCLSYPGSFLS